MKFCEKALEARKGGVEEGGGAGELVSSIPAISTRNLVEMSVNVFVLYGSVFIRATIINGLLCEARRVTYKFPCNKPLPFNHTVLFECIH